MKKKPLLTPPQKIRLLCHQTNSYAGFCLGCRKEVEMVGFIEAAQIVGSQYDEIIALAAAGALHLGIRPEAFLICLDSLLQADSRRRQKHQSEIAENSGVASSADETTYKPPILFVAKK